jgi:putative endonuclease
MKMWHVYILKCEGNRLYTGITNDLKKRVEQHKTGKGAKFTKAFKALKLLYSEKKRNKSFALKREAEIKSFTKQEKIALISGQ